MYTIFEELSFIWKLRIQRARRYIILHFLNVHHRHAFLNTCLQKHLSGFSEPNGGHLSNISYTFKLLRVFDKCLYVCQTIFKGPRCFIFGGRGAPACIVNGCHVHSQSGLRFKSKGKLSLYIVIQQMVPVTFIR